MYYIWITSIIRETIDKLLNHQNHSSQNKPHYTEKEVQTGEENEFSSKASLLEEAKSLLSKHNNKLLKQSSCSISTPLDSIREKEVF